MDNGKIYVQLNWNGENVIFTGTLIEMSREYGGIQQRMDLTIYVDEFGEYVKKIDGDVGKMSVKIQKQPREISLKELKKSEEFEKVIIYIDEDVKEEFEKKYGLSYRYKEKIILTNTHLDFKENYLMCDDYNVPYEFITKIEVVDV